METLIDRNGNEMRPGDRVRFHDDGPFKDYYGREGILQWPCGESNKFQFWGIVAEWVDRAQKHPHFWWGPQGKSKHAAWTTTDPVAFVEKIVKKNMTHPEIKVTMTKYADGTWDGAYVMLESKFEREVVKQESAFECLSELIFGEDD